MTYKRLARFLQASTIAMFVLSAPLVESFAAGDAVISAYKLWASYQGTDLIRIQMAPGVAISNPDGCSDPDSYFVSGALSNPVRQRIFLSLAMAQVLKTSVRITFSGCQNSRPAVNAVITD